LALTSDIKGLKRERRDAKKNKEHSKKQKVNPEWIAQKAILRSWSVLRIFSVLVTTAVLSQLETNLLDCEW
jgi:hypothetical protein